MPRQKIHKETFIKYEGKTLSLYNYQKAESGFYLLYLRQILALLEQIGEPCYVIRPIIHLNQIAERNTHISELIKSFKIEICKLTGLDYTEIKHAWCLELTEELSWHYHTVFFLPKRAFKCGTYTPRSVLEQVNQELKEKNEIPASIVWPEDIVRKPDSPYFQALTFYDPHNLASFRHVFRILSYYAKVDTKKSLNGRRKFGASLSKYDIAQKVA